MSHLPEQRFVFDESWADARRDELWHLADECLRTLEAAELASKLANPPGKAALFAHWDAGDLCRRYLAELGEWHRTYHESA